MWRHLLFTLLAIVFSADLALASDACQTTGPPWLVAGQNGVITDSANFSPNDGTNYVAKVFSAVSVHSSQNHHCFRYEVENSSENGGEIEALRWRVGGISISKLKPGEDNRAFNPKKGHDPKQGHSEITAFKSSSAVVADHEGTDIDVTSQDVPVISSSSGFNGIAFYIDSFTDEKSSALQFKVGITGNAKIYAPLLAAFRAGMFENPTGFVSDKIQNDPATFLFEAGDFSIPLKTQLAKLPIAEHPITIKSDSGTGCFLVQTYAAISLKLGFEYCVP